MMCEIENLNIKKHDNITNFTLGSCTNYQLSSKNYLHLEEHEGAKF